MANKNRCRKCGQYRGPYDWASGKTRPGLGLCERCFVARVNLITAMISNQEGGPLSALIVCAAGTAPKREEAFAAGVRPSDAEVAAAMDQLTGVSYG
jgi:hypothetical protein